MYRRLFFSLALIGFTIAGPAARADYTDAYSSLTSAASRAVYRNLQLGYYSLGYLSREQVRLTVFLAYPDRAAALIKKQQDGRPLTPSDQYSLGVLSKASSLIGTFPAFGQVGFSGPMPQNWRPPRP